MADAGGGRGREGLQSVSSVYLPTGNSLGQARGDARQASNMEERREGIGMAMSSVLCCRLDGHGWHGLRR